MALPKQLRDQVKQGKEIEDQLRKEAEEAGSNDESQGEIDNLPRFWIHWVEFCFLKNHSSPLTITSD